MLMFELHWMVLNILLVMVPVKEPRAGAPSEALMLFCVPLLLLQPLLLLLLLLLLQLVLLLILSLSWLKKNLETSVYTHC